MTYDASGLIVGGIRSFRSLVAWIVTRNPCHSFACLFPAEKGHYRRPMQRVSSVVFYLKPPTFLCRRVSEGIGIAADT